MIKVAMSEMTQTEILRCAVDHTESYRQPRNNGDTIDLDRAFAEYFLKKTLQSGIPRLHYCAIEELARRRGESVSMVGCRLIWLGFKKAAEQGGL